MNFSGVFRVLLIHCLFALVGLSQSAQAIISPPQPVSQAQATTALAGLAVPFEENKGQADARVAFQTRTLGGPLFVTRDGELVWSLTPPHAAPSSHKSPAPQAPSAAETIPAWSVVERFVDGKPIPAGDGISPTQVSHFHGNDRGRWQSGTPTWARVNLGQVWTGVDVSLAAHGKNVEKVFTIAPGADAQSIAIEVVGGHLNPAFREKLSQFTANNYM